ncbi:MAG: hypothetical protein KDC98_08900 [Planctomycetes bacterium]|nr:hypothetical protein [Planctomycetota bacterium]
MKSALALAIAAAVPALTAQDRPTPASAMELPQLRAAFAAAPACEHAAVIAVVQGSEPVVLTAGTDSAGRDLTPLTLVPLLTLAKVLAADAIRVRLGDKIGEGSGEKLGDRELTVRELLDGVPVLPDYFVLDGGDDPADAALLRKCGALAAGAAMEPQASRLGAPEFVLLERMALGGLDKDWPSMLRTTLAPHVSGLDPVGADALGDQEQSTILAADDLAKLAKAQPSLLRTLLSLRNIGTWLQWRTQHETPLWTSARMGAMVSSRTKPDEQYWVTGSRAMGMNMLMLQYPTRRAALLRIAPLDQPKLMHQLLVAFEEDLFTDSDAPEASRLERLRAAQAAALVARAAKGAPAPSGLDGTSWSSTPAEGNETVRLAFGATAKEQLVLTLGGETLRFSMTRTGAGLRSMPWRRGTDMFWLWVRPEPDTEKPTKVTCVLIAGRVSDAHSSTFATTAAVPHCFELLPAKN